MKRDLTLPQLPKTDSSGNINQQELVQFLSAIQRILDEKQREDYGANEGTGKTITELLADLTTLIDNFNTHINNYNITTTKINHPNYSAGETKGYNVVHKADTNGWLSVIMQGSYMNGLQIFIGTTNNPTQEIARFGDDINSNTKWASVIIPIPKDYYYKVVPYGSWGWETIILTFYPTL